jgi:hypothetical protein
MNVDRNTLIVNMCVVFKLLNKISTLRGPFDNSFIIVLQYYASLMHSTL